MFVFKGYIELKPYTLHIEIYRRICNKQIYSRRYLELLEKLHLKVLSVTSEKFSEIGVIDFGLNKFAEELN